MNAPSFQHKTRRLKTPGFVLEKGNRALPYQETNSFDENSGKANF